MNIFRGFFETPIETPTTFKTKISKIKEASFSGTGPLLLSVKFILQNQRMARRFQTEFLRIGHPCPMLYL